MAKGPKDFSQTAFDLVARTTGAPTTNNLAKIERAIKGAGAGSESLKVVRRSKIAKAAAKR